MLTELKIKKSKPKDKKYKLYDSGYLYLEIYPNGIKQWVYEYKKIKSFRVGTYPALTLKAARLKRDEIKKEIELYGLENYLIKRNHKKNEKKRKFENVVNEWLELYKKEKAKRSIETTILRLNKYILPAFKGKTIDIITIKNIYHLLKKTPQPTAEKLKSILNGIFSYAITKEYIKHNIIKDIDLKHIYTKTSFNHYSYTSNLDEVKIYYNSIKDIKQNPIVKGAIKIIWLTALRQGSVRLIKWENIDYTKKLLFIPKENLKIKFIDFAIPLTDEAIEVFKELEKIKASEYVFYSPQKNKPISETTLRKYQNNIAIEHNITKQTLHGIRHTFATLTRQYLQKEHNIQDEVIEIALQHLDKNRIRAVYNHYDYFKERKELLNLWNEFLNNL